MMRISNFTRHEIYLLFQARVSRNRATKISPLRLKIKDQRSLCLSRVCLYRYRSKVKYHLDSPLRDFQKRGGLFESHAYFKFYLSKCFIVDLNRCTKTSSLSIRLKIKDLSFFLSNLPLSISTKIKYRLNLSLRFSKKGRI